jgi:hypothetical protein
VCDWCRYDPEEDRHQHQHEYELDQGVADAVSHAAKDEARGGADTWLGEPRFGTTELKGPHVRLAIRESRSYVGSRERGRYVRNVGLSFRSLADSLAYSDAKPALGVWTK